MTFKRIAGATAAVLFTILILFISGCAGAAVPTGDRVRFASIGTDF